MKIKKKKKVDRSGRKKKKGRRKKAKSGAGNVDGVGKRIENQGAKGQLEQLQLQRQQQWQEKKKKEEEEEEEVLHPRNAVHQPPQATTRGISGGRYNSLFHSYSLN